jgi:FMN phosphatase YigB (HAD superfamily)
LSFPSTQIRWLFFDLGNTLVDEQAATEVRLQQIAACFKQHGRRCSVDELRSALETACAEFAPRLITRALEN